MTTPLGGPILNLLYQLRFESLSQKDDEISSQIKELVEERRRETNGTPPSPPPMVLTLEHSNENILRNLHASFTLDSKNALYDKLDVISLSSTEDEKIEILSDNDTTDLVEETKAPPQKPTGSSQNLTLNQTEVSSDTVYIEISGLKDSHQAEISDKLQRYQDSGKEKKITDTGETGKDKE